MADRCFLAVTVILVSIAFFVMDRSSYFWWNTEIEIAFYAPCFVFVPISLLYLVYETVMTIKHGFYLSGFVSCANSALAWFLSIPLRSMFSLFWMWLEARYETTCISKAGSGLFSSSFAWQFFCTL